MRRRQGKGQRGRGQGERSKVKGVGLLPFPFNLFSHCFAFQAILICSLKGGAGAVFFTGWKET